jgi:hypothetical protein
MFGMQRHNQTSELLPRPEERPSLLLLRFLCRRSPLASGLCFAGILGFCFVGHDLHQVHDAEVWTSPDRFGVFPPCYMEPSGESKTSP